MTDKSHELLLTCLVSTSHYLNPEPLYSGGGDGGGVACTGAGAGASGAAGGVGAGAAGGDYDDDDDAFTEGQFQWKFWWYLLPE